MKDGKFAPVPDHRVGLPKSSPLRVSFTARSKNAKLGPIPSCRVTASTCPPSCGLYNAGCYGEQHQLREHWRRLGRLEHEGKSWAELCSFVAALPVGTLWRYAEVGDLPGEGEDINTMALNELVTANYGRRGFTYTHKHSAKAIDAARLATGLGFTVNLSADNLDQADQLYVFGPTVVILPEGSPAMLDTPCGRKVKVCPAELNPATSCATCGLCYSHKHGRSVIGFIAHGKRSREVSERARLRVLP